MKTDKNKKIMQIAFAVLLTMGAVAFAANASAQNVNVQSVKTDTAKKVVIDDAAKQQMKEINQQLNSLNVKVEKLNDKLGIQNNDTSLGEFIKMNGSKMTINFAANRKKDSIHLVKMEKRNIDVNWLFMFDLGINSYTHGGSGDLPNSLNGFELNLARSIEFNWHIVEVGVNLIHHNFYMTYGLELNINNYSFSNNVSFDPKASYSMPFVDSSANFKKDKLVTQFISIPVLFHYETNPFHSNHSFEIAAGGYGGLLINSHIKQVSDQFGTEKYYNGYNLNQYKYGLTARIGYGPLEIYASYNMSTLFQSGKGPELTPFTAGIVIGGFSWK